MAKYKAKQQSIMGGGGGGGLRHILHGTDWVTIGLCLLASAVGLVLVHSATRGEALLENNMFSKKLIMMAVGLSIGLVASLAMSFVDYELLLRFWYVIAGLCVLLMLALIPFGDAPVPERPDAKRWLTIAGITFQPSELLKLGFIISFTWHIHQVRGSVNKLKTIAMLGVHALIPFGLVAFTGDLGSALVLLSIAVGMLFLAGVKLRWFAGIAALGLAAVPLLWYKFIDNFQRNRIMALYWPEQLEEAVVKDFMYQQNQAMNAIGSGGLWGKGLFNGNVSIPVRENDMIFSVAA